MCNGGKINPNKVILPKFHYMKQLYIFALLVLISSCTQNSTVSVLKSFGYLGFGDTTLAKVKGKITTIDNKVEKPLPDVHISANGVEATTDKNGAFTIFLPRGTYTIDITKDGYKAVKLTNYNADSNQISDAEIILYIGKNFIAYDVSKNKIDTK